MFVEAVYETGRVSVMEVADKAEALRGLGEQHRRAKLGLFNGPQGGTAERIVKAYIYDEHPNEWNPGDAMTADELKKALPDLVNSLADENGVVPVGALAVEVRALTHPMVDTAGPHDSRFKMNAKSEVSQAEIDKASEA